MKIRVTHAASWVAQHFEAVTIAVAAVAALGAAVFVKCAAEAQVGEEFYAAIAQILPVFLVALAIEQRLFDRIGISEDEYVARANRSFDWAAQEVISFEDMNEGRALHYRRLLESQPDVRWVDVYAFDAVNSGGDPEHQPDIQLLARTRFRSRTRREAIFVVAAISLILVGEGAALGGLVHGGSSSDSPYLFVTIGATAAAFVVVAFGGARELVASFRS